MEADQLADAVLSLLARARHGEIVAVWVTGEVTLEGFGLWTRRTARGDERPLCEFVMSGLLPERVAVAARLERATRRPRV